MKHPLKITVMIIIMFLLAQFIGLAIITSYDNYFGRSSVKAVEAGELVKPEVSIVHQTIPPESEVKEPIDMAKIITSIAVALIIAIGLFFLLSRIRVVLVIRIWFAFVIFICLTITFSLALYPILSKSLFTWFGSKVALAEIIALPLAAIMTFLRMSKISFIIKNFIHNLTELFIYPGLAVIFLPLFGYSKLGVAGMAALLVIISIYDMIAVWKTKFMIRLAEFQIKHVKTFTGFFLPYIKPKDKVKIQKLRALAKKQRIEEKKRRKGKGKSKVGKGKKWEGKKKKQRIIKVALGGILLGGGDIAFPLIFAGTILLAFGLAAAIITVLCVTLSLVLLLTFSEKGRFYPAMPFLTGGCFLGWLLVWLLL